jgi:hypothetical protein
MRWLTYCPNYIALFVAAIGGQLLLRPASSHRLVSINQHPTKYVRQLQQQQSNNVEDDEYTTTTTTCTGSSIITGEYRIQNSYLCYTNNNTTTTNNDEVVSTFGINNNGELVYIVK